MKKALSIVLAALMCLLSLSPAVMAEETLPEAATYAEMTQLVRAALLARETTFRFRYTGGDDPVPTLDDLCAYSDDGAAGDYLRLSFNGAPPQITRMADGSYTVTASFYTDAEMEAEVDAFAQSFAEGCAAETPLEKARSVYTYLCDTVRFDLENLYNEEDLLKYTAYGAVSEGKAVCLGFAALYYRLALAVGLDCRIVTGTRSGESHAWNIVKLDDLWYHVDVSCGSQLLNSEAYFLQPLFQNYAVVYGDWTAPEIEDYSFAGPDAPDGYDVGALSYTVSWALEKASGRLTVSGSGEIPPAASGASPFYADERIVSAVFSGRITAIGTCLFEDCAALTQITLPGRLESVGEGAFAGCEALTDVYFCGSEEQWNDLTVGGGNDALLNASVHFSEDACGETLTWLLDSEGTMVISGEGDMYDYKNESAPWYASAGEIRSIVIADGVESVGDYAFSGLSALASVTIPDSVTTIGRSAFYNCTGLTAFTVGDGVVSIGHNAFYNCTELARVDISDLAVWYRISFSSRFSNPLYYAASLYVDHTLVTGLMIPDGISKIGNHAFCGWTALTAVNIPDSVTEIGSYAFYGCAGLTAVNIPDSVTEIGSYAFDGCTGLTRVDISDLAAWLGINFGVSANPLSCAKVLYLNNSPVTDLTVPEGLTEIGAFAFDGCAGLTALTIPEGVTEIGQMAFRNCAGLTTVTLPDSLTSIGNYAFEYCTGLEAITIPDDVTQIGTFAFEYCDSLQTVRIGRSVTSMDDAFAYCPVISSITVDAQNPVYHAEGNCLIETETKTLVKACGTSVIPADGSVTSIGKYAFVGCTGLKEIYIPGSVTALDKNSKTSILGYLYVFDGCTNLETVVLGQGVGGISHAFNNNPNLTSLVVLTPYEEISLDFIMPGGITWKRFPKLTITCTEHWSVNFGSSNENYPIVILENCVSETGAHSDVWVEATPATCVEPAYSAGVQCRDCGMWFMGHTETAEPLGHTPAEAVRETVTQPTCTAEGAYNDVVYCAVCGERLSATPGRIAMLPHADNDRNGYCDECGADICDHAETQTVNEKAATCTAAGYSGDTLCLICGRTLAYGETVPAAGHKPVCSKEAKPATCLEQGYTAEYTCSVCHDVTTESTPLGTTAHTDSDGDGFCDVCRAPTDSDQYGECGSDLYWYIADETLFLSGSGAYAAETAPWAAYGNDFDLVYIKEGVASVDGTAFNACDRVEKVFVPAGTALSDCGKPTLTYTFTNGEVLISDSAAYDVYALLDTAYILCTDHTVAALRFDTLRLAGADGSAYIEYDVLKNGKLIDENHFRLVSGTAVSDITFRAAGYASFNAVMAALGSHPDRNLILSITCADLLPAELQGSAGDYTEQIVVRFVDEPIPSEPEQPDTPPAPHGDDPGSGGGQNASGNSLLDRFRATLAAILAVFKKIFKMFKK